MSEVIVAFDSDFRGPDQVTYRARAVGQERPDHMWDGWLEFVPLAGGIAARTDRETTQPNRAAVLYWATGLTTTYIDGALDRTLGAPLPRVGDREIAVTPAFTAPSDTIPKPLLDPFRVYAEGPNLLRGQLEALDDDQLVAIAQAYGIAGPSQIDVATRAEIISLIMLAAEKRTA